MLDLVSIAFSTSSGNEIFSIISFVSSNPRFAKVAVSVSVATFENSSKFDAISSAEIFDSAIVSEIDETMILFKYELMSSVVNV